METAKTARTRLLDADAVVKQAAKAAMCGAGGSAG
jgi:hypothetical protein